MLTRHGWGALLTAAAAFVTGRVFGLIELYVVGACMVAVTLVAVAVTAVRTPALQVERHTEPAAPVAGQPIRVVVAISHHGRRRLSELHLWEQVGAVGGATMSLAPLPPETTVEAAYSIPAGRRGVLACGPLRARHTDPLGLAGRSRIVADADEVIVLPVTVPLLPPRVGSPGTLGQLLQAKAVAQGGIDFHGLREYVDGDDPRRISWKASARSTALLVREHADDELRRVTVALDARINDDDAFERAISAAASVVLACATTELDIRVVSQEADWRGQDVVAAASRWMAVMERAAESRPVPPGPSTPEGLGVVVLVSDRADSNFVTSARAQLGRNQTVITVTTGGAGGRFAHGQLVVEAATLDQLTVNWNMLVGGSG